MTKALAIPPLLIVVTISMLRGIPALLRSSVFRSRPRRSTTRLSSSAVNIVDKQWRNHPEIEKSVKFPTWVVPSRNCQAILKSDILQSYLGHLDHVQPRVRLVQPHSKTHQLILRDQKNKELSEEALDLLESLGVQLEGPTFQIDLDSSNWTVPYILQQILPPEVHPPPTSYEQIGHVAHLNLKAIHEPYGKLIGEVILNSVPNIETVVNKVGEVTGEFRTYDMQLLAGKNTTKVQLQENGVKLEFDVKDVYWCSRLSGEREYMLTKVFKNGQVIVDPFCGVGAQLLQAASKLGCNIIANDWNPNAVSACRANVALNRLQDRFEEISCEDAYDFLTDVGLSDRLPDHVIMNFPLEAPKFLSALRWWSVPAKSQNFPTFHVYTFARDDIYERCFEDVAIDLIADNLLPLGGAVEQTSNRRGELDSLGCKVESRLIRDVAPGKMVVCVSFRATRKLIKQIQGDFI